LSMANSPYQSRLIAHRGANNAAPDNQEKKLPENSLVALHAAFLAGVSRVELDVIRLKCGTFIVFHDDTLERVGRFNPEMATTLTQKRFLEIYKTKLTELRFEEVSQIDVGLYDPDFGDIFRGTAIPLLEDFLRTLKKYPSGQLVIELKADSVTIIPAFQLLITEAKQKYGLKDEQLVFISFDYALIQASRTALPSHQHFLVTVFSGDSDIAMPDPTDPKKYIGLYHPIRTEAELIHCIAMAKNAALDGLDIEYSPKIDEAFVKKIHDAGLKVIVWTYPENDRVSCLYPLLKAGVDFINTNQPKKIAHQLQSVDDIHKNRVIK